jgi:hypothetical protein
MANVGKIEFETYFTNLSKDERGEKLVSVQKKIVNFLCQEKLTISESEHVVEALRAYVRYSKTYSNEHTAIFDLFAE